MDFYSTWNVVQNGMSLNMECHSKLNVIEIERHSKWNVIQNGKSLKIEFHSKLDVTQKEMSLKMECH